VPHVVRNDQGEDIWVIDGVKVSTVGGTAAAGFADFPPKIPPTLADCHPAAYDAAARLRYMDEIKIWAMLLYPNVAGFGSQRFLSIRDSELQLLCVRAYNDFLPDWASADPDRLLTVMSIPFWDVQAAVAEIERCAPLGFRGILFTGEPQRFGLPTLGSSHWDPLWSVAQEARLPVHFHIGAGEDTPSPVSQERVQNQGRPRALAHAANELYLKNAVQCSDLITSGVLERYPELRFVSVESGIGWIPFVLEAADYSYLGATQPGRVRTADLLPSELFARQVYCSYWFEQVAPTHLFDVIPVDNILFETDFPHMACLYENVAETIESGLANASEDVRRKVLWENSARLYGIKEPVLQ
jgi:predicted TIM-barrel fold metal-dependent hydrolase